MRLWSSDGTLSQIIESSPAKSLKFKPVQLVHKRILPITAYNDIIQQNLFSIEREEYKPEAVKPEKELKPEIKPEPKVIELNTNKIVLYGVIIMGDYKKALVTNVDKISNSNSIWVEKGDTVDEFVIDSIEKDRLLVTKSGKRFSILLYDKENPKKRKFVKNNITPTKKVIVTQPAKPAKSSVASKKDDTEYEIISTPFGEFKRKKQK